MSEGREGPDFAGKSGATYAAFTTCRCRAPRRLENVLPLFFSVRFH